MNNLILESLTGTKSKTLSNKNIFLIDPSKPENKDTFKYKDILKKHGAEWSLNPKYKNIFPPHTKGFWFWFIGDTEEQWKKIYNLFIEPALKEIYAKEGISSEETQNKLVAVLDEIIKKVESAKLPEPSQSKIKPLTKEELKSKLIDFKEKIVNLDNEEEFKELMRKFIAFKNLQGHQYSDVNTILIWLQNPNAKFVLSKIRWERYYNRKVKPNARPMYVFSPSKFELIPYTEEEKKEIIDNFLKKRGKSSYDELTVGEKDKLGVILRGRLAKRAFDVTEVYDIEDTEPIEGKEDVAKVIDDIGKVKWYEENMIDDSVRPLYIAAENFAKSLGIKVIEAPASELQGARGYSSEVGVIKIIENQKNDVGLTKTLFHEIAHSLLHQKYVSSKNTELSKYFIGREEGREKVEQQAELAAWLIMNLYGFDLKTTPINYMVLWGANKEMMIEAYDTVTNVVNYIVENINERLESANIKEGEMIQEKLSKIKPAKKIKPLDIARILNQEEEYLDALKSVERMVESLHRFQKLINYRQKT